MACKVHCAACSDCQRADWKAHKQLCRPPSDSLSAGMFAWLRQYMLCYLVEPATPAAGSSPQRWRTAYLATTAGQHTPQEGGLQQADPEPHMPAFATVPLEDLTSVPHQHIAPPLARLAMLDAAAATTARAIDARLRARQTASRERARASAPERDTAMRELVRLARAQDMQVLLQWRDLPPTRDADATHDIRGICQSLEDWLLAAARAWHAAGLEQ